MNIIPWHRRESSTPASFDFDDLIERFWGEGNGSSKMRHLPEVFRSRPFPAVNIAETEDGFSITMDCPGMKEEEIQIEAMGHQLLISGERKWEEEKKGKEYHRVESQYGKFERTVQLPENARTEAGQVDAKYKKGVLTITVPKREKTPTSKIPVKAG